MKEIMVIGMSNFAIRIISFYKFVELDNFYDMKSPLEEVCKMLKIKGTILLAEEGINATVAGEGDSVYKLLEFLNTDERFGDMPIKESLSDFLPFQKLSIRLKHEIVRMGIDDIDVYSESGEYLDHDQWDKMMSDDNTYIIDTRNQYEYDMGTFKDAISPNTESFRQFPLWSEDWAQKISDKSNVKIMMFCTGGIRCEKATCYMRKLGFDKVYHLKGGILDYLKNNKNPQENWKGDCFVFDDRVGVDNTILPIKGIKCNECGGDATLGDIRDSSRGVVTCESCVS